MNLNSKYYFDNYGYRVGNTRCRSGKCCNLISVGCVQWDFPSTELYSKKETLEEILRKIEELLSGSFPIKNIGEGYKIYAGIEDEANAFKTFTSSDGVIITTTPTTINIGFDTSTLPDTGVTSVGLQAPLGFSIINSPVTSAGDLIFDWDSGYTPYTTAEKTKLAGIEDGAQVNVQSDWNATSGAAQILNKPTLATVATTGDYNDLINLPTLTTGTVTSVALTAPTGLQVTGSPITTSGTLALTFQAGYSIPTNTSQSNWDTAYGWGNHADAGYLTTETDPTVPSHVKAITTADISNWDTAYSQRIQTFTTTGNSGAATFTGNTLNIPNYTLSGLGGVPLTRSITINGVTQNLSANRTWNITPDYSALSNQKHLKYDTATGKPVDSNITDITEGVEVDGIVNTSGVQLNDTTTTPQPNQITRNGDKLKYTDTTGTTRDVMVGFTTEDDGDIEFTGDGTPTNPLSAIVGNKIPYKTIDTSVTEPDLAQLNAYGTDRVDFPNLDRIYFLNGAKWTYVETIDL